MRQSPEQVQQFIPVAQGRPEHKLVLVDLRFNGKFVLISVRSSTEDEEEDADGTKTLGPKTQLKQPAHLHSFFFFY